MILKNLHRPDFTPGSGAIFITYYDLHEAGYLKTQSGLWKLAGVKLGSKRGGQKTENLKKVKKHPESYDSGCLICLVRLI